MSKLVTPFGFESTTGDVLRGVDLSGKTALVTGANSGIGYETARALASAGAAVVVAARRDRAGSDAAAQIAVSTGNPHVSHILLDLADLESVARAAAGWSGPLVPGKAQPTEMYAGCMTDFSHPEPTTSCVAALARFRHDYSGYQPRRVDHAIRRGIRYLRSCQRPDGSYQGTWGINFTYAACFVTEALLTAGVPGSDPAISRTVGWLREHQKPDGGWGEHHTSCLTGRYAEHPDSQAAMTAWALLVLLRTAGPGDPGARRALRCLESLQQHGTGGGWPRQAASGVFFQTAVLDYRLYKDIFPTWALAAASQNPADLIPHTQPPIRPLIPGPPAAQITQIRAITGHGATTKAAVPKADTDS